MTARYEIVDFLLDKPELTREISEAIRLSGDLERLISKVSLNRINPRELQQIAKALEQVSLIKEKCQNSGNSGLMKLSEQFNPCQIIGQRILKELTDEPPALLSKGKIIGSNVSQKLDELRGLSRSGKEFLQQLQKREMENTGIPALKWVIIMFLVITWKLPMCTKTRCQQIGFASKH